MHVLKNVYNMKEYGTLILGDMMERNEANFAAVIKEARISRGLTQAKMAEYLDTTVRHYQDIERGRKNPGGDILYRLVHKVGVRPEMVFSVPGLTNDSEYLDICHLLKYCDEKQLSVIRATLEALRRINQA